MKKILVITPVTLLSRMPEILRKIRTHYPRKTQVKTIDMITDEDTFDLIIKVVENTTKEDTVQSLQNLVTIYRDHDTQVKQIILSELMIMGKRKLKGVKNILATLSMQGSQN